MSYLKTSNLPVLSIASALLLSACGGGGGSGGSTPTPTPAPVADTTAPSLTFTPATLSVESGTTGSATLGRSDNVGITVGPDVTCTNGGAFNVTTNIFTAAAVTEDTQSICTATASDAAGNQGTATLTVTMTPPPPDTTAPTLTFEPATLTVETGRTATAILTVTENAVPTVSCTAGGSFDVATNLFTAAVVTETTESVCTATATDEAGNEGTGTLTVTMSPTPVSTAVSLSGTLTYDRVPVDRGADGLLFDETVRLPIRQAPVELVNAAGAVLDSTVSDDNGDYSFEVEPGEEVRVRVRSEVQMDGANVIDMQVVDNTSNDSLYALQGAVTEVPAQNQTRDLHAASGWGGSSYTGTRAAAPFALLDTIYSTMEAFIEVDPEIDFPGFDVQWSVNNIPAGGNVDTGSIGTSSFTIENRPTGPVPVLRILGAENNDTDEYDVHVVVHEFGHYFENQFSRSDSLGGVHGLNDLLDPRVAFGEGWGNALSAMILDNPDYRDTFDSMQSRAGGFDVESNSFVSSGWYSEGSVQSILYDLFDDDDDGADSASYGLAPIYGAFIDPDYAQTPAFTTIFSFLEAFGNQANIVPSEVTAILSAQDISGTTEFGIGETNAGRITGALPVYLPLPTNGTEVPFCSFNNFSIFNKHGNRRYFEFDIPTTGSYRFEIRRDFSASADSGTPTSDPDLVITRQGQPVNNIFAGQGASGVNNSETLTINLTAGQHVMEAYAFENTSTRDGGVTPFQVTPNDFCFTMSLEAQ